MHRLQGIPAGSILGLNFTGLHDSAIAVVSPEAEILFACSLERISRKKKDGRWPSLLLDQVPWDKIHSIALSTLDNSAAESLAQLYAKDGWSLPATGADPAILKNPEEWQELIGSLPKPVLRFEHHQSHAASAWYLSDFDRALTITCDAGAYQSPWFAAAYNGSGQDMDLLGGMQGEAYRSPAKLYSVVTAIIGLRPNNHEGKVTGLAARASVTEAQIAEFEKIIWPAVYETGSLMRWDVRLVDNEPGFMIENHWKLQRYRQQLSAFSNAELAACVQTVTERLALAIVQRARSLSPEPHNKVCLAGGLFANVCINRRIVQAFDQGFIAPPMTDDGTALGAALLAHRKLYPDSPTMQQRASMFLGPQISEADSRQMVQEEKLQYSAPSQPAQELARLLAADKVVAIARGAMEFGPRALGHRSILYRPADPTVNDWLNKKLSRTEYMPFAPMTLREDVDACYTDPKTTSPFMTMTVECKAEMREQCPAVVHVDGTARPQIIDREDNPFMHAVLTELKTQTGCGTVLNTSFNMHEEPIVCSSHDAILGFAQSQLDALFLGDMLILRAGNESILQRMVEDEQPGVMLPDTDTALTKWLSDTQEQLVQLQKLRREWFDPELIRLEKHAQAGDTEKLELLETITQLEQALQKERLELTERVERAERLARLERLEGRKQVKQLERSAAEKEQETEESHAQLTDLNAKVADLDNQMGSKEENVRQLITELSGIKSSLTWKANRVFDSLRRGQVREFSNHLKGFVRTRSMNLARRFRRAKPEAALNGTLQQLEPVKPQPQVQDRQALRTSLAKLLPSDLPRISAIVPCYNYGRVVMEAVRSLQAQTYANLEILVVNDGSTDQETLQALAELADSGIKVIHQDNAGLVGARQTGAKEATGEWLIFLDNDDLLEPEAIGLLALKLLQNPNAAYAYPDQHFFGDENLVWETQAFNAYDLLWSNHPTVCSLIRKASFEQTSGYNKDMVHGWEDWEFWIALADAKQFGSRLPVPVFKHRRHGHTMTHEAKAKGDILRNTLLDAHPKLYSPQKINQIKAQWRPGISVIVPFYNAHEFFDETLQSLKRQTFADFEIIIVNDASDEPKSQALLEQLRQRDDLRVIDRSTRGDLSAARNTGVRSARSENVFFLDPDDLLHPTALEKLLWLLLLSPEIGFVYTGVVHFGEQSGVCIDPYDVERLKHENFLTSAALVRKSVYLGVGGMEENIKLLFEDYDFWLRLAALGIHGKLLPEALFYYRRHHAGRSAWVRKQMTDGQMVQFLRKRNPVLYGEGTVHPEHYKSMRTQEPMCTQEVNAANQLEGDFAASYRQELNLPYDSYRRPNVPTPFMQQHWTGDKTRILYFIPHMTVGGAERIDLDILDGMDHKQFHIVLVVEMAEGQEWKDKFEKRPQELFILPHLSKDRSQQVAFLEYLLMSRNIDIVFNRNTYAGYEAIQEWHQKYSQVRFVDLLHLHNFGEDWITQSTPRDSYLHRRFLTSYDLKDYIGRECGLIHDRFQVVHCGVDTKTWNPQAVQSGKLRQELGIPAEVPIIGFVGRLHEQKNPLIWLQAAQCIAEKHADCVFVMIGDGPLEKKVTAAWRKSVHKNRIHLLGYRDDIQALMIDLDILLLTSGYEGLPQVVFEAMSLGVPVVSSDAGGTRECVTKGLGIIVPLNSEPAGYATAVLDLLADTAGRLARRKACAEQVQQRFSLELMHQRYLQIFAEMKTELRQDARLREYQLRLLQSPIL